MYHAADLTILAWFFGPGLRAPKIPGAIPDPLDKKESDKTREPRTNPGPLEWRVISRKLSRRPWLKAEIPNIYEAFRMLPRRPRASATAERARIGGYG